MNQIINIKAYGKWILAGEYSVLKSCPALVFPLFSQFMELSYQAGSKSLKIKVNSSKNTDLFPENFHFISVFESVLDQALQNIFKNHSDLRGTITLNPHISFGAGMGASAVVCVLIGRLFYQLKWLKKEKLFPFCHSLENTLHGQSSGVDIAAVLTGKPLLFTTKSNIEEQTFHPQWQPLFFLSHSGKGSSTKLNIKKIKQFWEEDSQKADLLNQQMTQAVLIAKEGLEMQNKKKGLNLLVKSFSLAEGCFSKWNLISQDMQKHISFLKTQGALGTKPTGSGAGGCVLSLWPKSPPTSLSNQLISAF